MWFVCDYSKGKFFSQKPVYRRLEYTLQHPKKDTEEPSTRCSFTDL